MAKKNLIGYGLGLLGFRFIYGRQIMWGNDDKCGGQVEMKETELKKPPEMGLNQG